MPDYYQVKNKGHLDPLGGFVRKPETNIDFGQHGWFVYQRF
jgi:hypothetical protein